MTHTHKLTPNPSLRSALAGVVVIFLCLSASWASQAPSRRSDWALGRTTFIKHCAVCHHENSGTRAPLLNVLQQMSRQQILDSLQTGVMRAQGSQLTSEEREAVAGFLSRQHNAAQRITTGFCAAEPPLQTGDASWNGWGNSAANMRFQTASGAQLDRDQVRRLKLKWAFGFPTGSTVEPTVFGGRVLIGGNDGSVFSLDARTGCIAWVFKASAGIRAALSVSADGEEVYVGDSRANVYALKADSGTAVWKSHVDPHPSAVITGAPLLLNGVLYVPVSSGEEGAAINPYYPCCTFRGSVVALDAKSGKQIWKAYAIPQAPKPTGKNAVGVTTWGPSGAAIWSSPTADVRRRAIYIGTGNNYSDPPDSHSDAVLAFDMQTGRMLWSRQATPDDRWTLACLRSDAKERINCPPNYGDDYDFGTSPILASLPDGHSLILAAQKSGVVYALDPDRDGKIVWRARIGKGGPEGGIEWGGAADGGRAYFAISDWRQSVSNAGGGLVAFNLATGQEIWHAKPPRPACIKTPGCSAAQIAPVTLIPGIVFSGSMDGHLRAYDARDGNVIWDFDTLREFKTTDGIAARGGSLNKNGPTIAGGMLYVESGNFVGMPGNVLLAFSVDGR
jgi:polyvinyl alcohol dehydrogenase (cytochrome)